MLKTIVTGLLRKRTSPEALNELGIVKWREGDLSQATRIFREMIRRYPRFAPAYGNLGAVLFVQNRFDEALAVFEEGVALDPEHVSLQTNLAMAYHRGRRIDKAIAHYRQALERDPAATAARSHLLRAYLDGCHWRSAEAMITRLTERFAQRDGGNWQADVSPFVALQISSSAAFQLAVASYHARHIARAVPAGPVPARPTVRRREKNARIRLGYLSGDFREHAVAHQTLPLYGLHDRERFEVFCYSIGPDDGSVYRRRIAADADEFVDLTALSHVDAASKIRHDGIDILIDMAGHSGNSRPEIPALRPAPVQISYLGYPGTSGASWIDVMVADNAVIPAALHEHYSERIVYLPDCYLMAHAGQPVAERPSRRELGLPETGFVYCCFNQSSKITREMFEAWLEILQQVPGSVLWLYHDNDEARRCIEAEVAARDFAVGRVFFAGRVASKAEHLARYRAADLFLDTFPYTAHATGCDALWAGLPVLSMAGESFASRVGMSLLINAGLPELVVTDRDAYVRTAIELGRHPHRVHDCAERLRRRRENCALFDAPRYVQNLEALFSRLFAGYASRCNRDGPA